MEFGKMNKLTIVIRFVLHTLHCSIMHLDVTTRKTTKKLENLNVGGVFMIKFLGKIPELKNITFRICAIFCEVAVPCLLMHIYAAFSGARKNTDQT